ncbi:hypothetical protein Tco_1027384 [Tanacetum coccineum]
MSFIPYIIIPSESKSDESTVHYIILSDSEEKLASTATMPVPASPNLAPDSPEYMPTSNVESDPVAEEPLQTKSEPFKDVDLPTAVLDYVPALDTDTKTEPTEEDHQEADPEEPSEEDPIKEGPSEEDPP